VHSQARIDRAESVFPPERPETDEAPLTPFLFYILGGASDRVHKVGVTADILTRVAELSRIKGEPLRVLRTYQSPTGRTRLLESRVKAMLADRQIEGEWFAVTADEAIAATEMAMQVIESEPPSGQTSWTIPAVSSEVSLGIVSAARRANLNVGQFLEKIWDEYKSGIPASSHPLNGLTAVVAAAASITDNNRMPRELRGLINDMARTARAALPHRKPGRTVKDGTAPRLQGPANGAAPAEVAHD
jgi:hypothetical protein